jgi:predicted Zn-dependent protease
MRKFSAQAIFALIFLAAACAPCFALEKNADAGDESPAIDFPYKIYILMYKGVEREPLEAIAAEIEAAFQFPVVFIDEPAELPEDAYNESLGRYSAVRVLEHAMLQAPEDAARLVAVFPGDMAIGGAEYNFGLADPDARGAGIATFRLQTGERKRFRARLLKVIFQELGHTFGLQHSVNTNECVMTVSRNVAMLDAKPARFGEPQRAKLNKAIAQLKADLLENPEEP